MNDEQDNALHDAARSALDQQVQSLPPEIKRSLHQARAKAMENSHRKASIFSGKPSTRKNFYPAGIAAALILAALWFPQEDAAPINPPATQLNAEILDMLSSEEDLSFYEDLEFINWLAMQSEQG
ncbi:MAG: hypothetical protein CSA60_00110 [Neptuniibacter caesariensis]|uniref:DUF3619 family protein n=1 Tax=Neptuniibacter caesariensis TaxID=207954 RepID=A0A2G6JQ06_NEPCE|nr:MAG: hypothetical protein CSA60_00110 [Neptuniibacter caesariensis]